MSKSCKNMLAGMVSIVLAACATDAQDSKDDVFAQSLTDAEQSGLLSFVNDCQTTVQMLDEDAALDSRAANNIVSSRDGADRTCSTEDDSSFGNLGELDDVPYVGNVALTLLLEHAQRLGYIQSDTGIYEGVTFTDQEAQLALAIANGASFDILDDDVGLDRRAAAAIGEARPFFGADIPAEMHRLTQLPYVGSSALRALRGYTTNWASCSGAAADIEGHPFSPLELHDTLDLLNMAPQDVLQEFSGIGAVLADRIVQGRPYETATELAAIPGIGQGIVLNVREQLDQYWCSVDGARCGCPSNASYRPPLIHFDENGLYNFLWYSQGWDAERIVDSGSISHDGTSLVLENLTVADDPDGWQDISDDAFQLLWDCCLHWQYDGQPLQIGPQHRGILHMGRAINASDGQLYVLVFWQDIDDASFAWIYRRDEHGEWQNAGQVFLN